MGTAAASAGAAGPSEGLRAGRSRGRTNPEYPVSSGRRDHATFGSGPTRQSDDRDSEPDFLLRPTRHGPGGTWLIIAHSFLERKPLKIQLGPKLGFEGDRCNDTFLSWRYFESVIKGPPALAEDSVLTPIPVWRILVLFSNRDES